MTAKHRFVVVDYGSVMHRLRDPCPPWCHLCPHVGGAVMPYCYGSVVGNFDENDLMACTCEPSDPIVTHASLVHKTETLLRLLRAKRRHRSINRVALGEILKLAKLMRGSMDTNGLRRAMGEIARLAEQLRQIDMSESPPTTAEDQ